jgi:hypothetical protein
MKAPGPDGALTVLVMQGENRARGEPGIAT